MDLRLVLVVTLAMGTTLLFEPAAAESDGSAEGAAPPSGSDPTAPGAGAAADPDPGGPCRPSCMG